MEVRFNNPYLIDLLVYLVKLSFSIREYDEELNSTQLKKIQQATDEILKAENTAYNFFKRKYNPPGIGQRYFSTVAKLDSFCKLITHNGLSYPDWLTFYDHYWDLASGYEIFNKENLQGSEAHAAYYKLYKPKQAIIKKDILARFGDGPAVEEDNNSEQEVEPITTLPEKPPYMVGEERLLQLEELSAYLLDPEKPLCIIGMPGSGKTNFARNLKGHKRVVEHYKHRFEIGCQKATTYDLFIQSLASETGTRTPSESEDQTKLILDRLSRLKGRKLILLDNFETCQENYAVEVYELARFLEAQATLIHTMRTTAAPQGPDNWKVEKVKPLEETDAGKLFHHHTDNRFLGDKYVSRFLKEVGNLPLAVKLIARRANGEENNLGSLYQEWEETKLKLLDIDKYFNDKESSLIRSILLSFDSFRLTTADRALLKAICEFPASIRYSVLKNLFPKTAYDQKNSLVGVGLVEESTENRLDIHATIREFMTLQQLEAEPYGSSFIDYYLDLALEYGPNVWNSSEARQALEIEWENIYHALQKSIAKGKGIKAVCEMVSYGLSNGRMNSLIPLLKQGAKNSRLKVRHSLEANCFRGLGNVALRGSDVSGARINFSEALRIYKSIKNQIGEADCLQRLGEVALMADDVSGARENYSDAQQIYNTIKHRSGEANCLLGLGSAALRDNNVFDAQESYSKAQQLYKSVKDGLGEANCLERLAGTALMADDISCARKNYSDALLIYKSIKEQLGEANCLQGLGDVAIRDSDVDGARENYSNALQIYKIIKDRPGEANCLLGLGDVAITGNDVSGARENYSNAQQIFKSINDLLGEANCLQGLGDVAIRDNDVDGAQENYSKAQQMYTRIGEQLGEAYCLRGLGDVALRADDISGAKKRYSDALQIYKSIKNRLGEANCLEGLVNTALKADNVSGARENFTDALQIFKSIEDLPGEANCLQGLGDVALIGSDMSGARRNYNDALLVFKSIEDRLGEANCFEGLGNVALRDSDVSGARKNYGEALQIYKSIGDRLGQAHCLRVLGDAALRANDVSGARKNYDEALHIQKHLRPTGGGELLLP